MKKLSLFTLLLISSLCFANKPFDPYAEDPKGDKIIELYKTYSTTLDKGIVDKTIKIINDGLYDEGTFEIRFKGFFSALFEKDAAIKAEFEKKKSKIKNNDFVDLFDQILSSSVEDIYTNAPNTIDVNEMLVYSYYGTGDMKYINQLLMKAKDVEERVDLDKFMIGANALWWLATLKADDEKVLNYLAKLPNDKYATIAFKSRAYDLKNEQLKILEDQKKKNIWK
jgi:hypothetical protein